MTANAGGGSPPARPRRSVRVAARALQVVVPLVLVAGAEFALRVAGVADYDPAAAGAEARRVLDLTDPRLFVPDAELFWRLRPGDTFDLGEPEFPRFSTNDLGLRGGPVPAERAPGEVLVLCLGDSITFGLGLEEGRTLPERVEVRLRERPELRSRGVRVVNGGVPGYSSVQGLRLLRRLGALRPDVVVWCFGMNDAKPALGRADADLTLSACDPSALRRAIGSLRLVRLGARLVGGAADPGPRVGPDDFGGALREFDGVAAASGARVVFVETPQRLGVRIAQFETVLGAARAAGAADVRASAPLLSPWTPTPVASDLVSRVEVTPDGRRRVVFGNDDAWADQVVAVADVERRLEDVRTWERRLRAIEALLPSDRLARADLFTGVAATEVYTDNCHLTPAGADAAAAAITARCAEVLRERETPGGR